MSSCSKPNDPVPGTTPPASVPEAPGTSASPGGTAPAPGPAAQQDTPPVAPPGPVAPCVTCEITSETIMTQPPDRTRTSIGVGERVSVTFSLGDAAWTLAGEGFLSSPTGQTIIYRAPSQAQTVTLTATGGGCTATKSFTIIAPTSVKMRTRDTLHHHDSVTIGLHTDIYILPDTVNFHAIDVREVDVALVSSGVFAPLAGGGHIRNPPSGVGSAVAATSTVRSGFGTKIDAVDTILLGFLGALPLAAVGRGQWTIPWQYALRGGTFRNFDTVRQVHTCDAIGNLRASKAHAVATATYATPSSGSITRGGVTTVL
ncbi:MAG: hypothetical protein PHF56_13110 [Desulfuromonadaceae bacterium]|nr:hypothetical protein [Desulfuromonadaceae bacterium]